MENEETVTIKLTLSAKDFQSLTEEQIEEDFVKIQDLIRQIIKERYLL